LPDAHCLPKPESLFQTNAQYGHSSEGGKHSVHKFVDPQSPSHVFQYFAQSAHDGCRQIWQMATTNGAAEAH